MACLFFPKRLARPLGGSGATKLGFGGSGVEPGTGWGLRVPVGRRRGAPPRREVLRGLRSRPRPACQPEGSRFQRTFPQARGSSPRPPPPSRQCVHPAPPSPGALRSASVVRASCACARRRKQRAAPAQQPAAPAGPTKRGVVLANSGTLSTLGVTSSYLGAISKRCEKPSACHRSTPYTCQRGGGNKKERARKRHAPEDRIDLSARRVDALGYRRSLPRSAVVPGISAMSISPSLRQPTRSSHVRAAATGGGSRSGGTVVRQPPNHRPEDAGSIRAIEGNARPLFAR